MTDTVGSARDRLAALLTECLHRKDWNPHNWADWLTSHGVTLAAPAPAGPSADFFLQAAHEAAMAMLAWPNEEIYHRLAALTGEVGELAEGVIKNRPDVEREAVQVAACAYRCWKSLRGAPAKGAP